MKCFESVKHNRGDNYLIRKSNNGKRPAWRASSRDLAQKQSRAQPGGALLTPNLLFPLTLIACSHHPDPAGSNFLHGLINTPKKRSVMPCRARHRADFGVFRRY